MLVYWNPIIYLLHITGSGRKCFETASVSLSACYLYASHYPSIGADQYSVLLVLGKVQDSQIMEGKLNLGPGHVTEDMKEYVINPSHCE